MVNSKKGWSKFIQWMLVLLITLGIILGRITWIQYFSSSNAGQMQNGILDLKEWDQHSGDTLLLDGEWRFYPNKLIQTSSEATDQEVTSLSVPGAWESALEDNNFGYGTYILTIQLKPDDKQNYSIYIPSVQSASSVYINGSFAGGAGQPAEHKLNYVAHNVPYISMANANEYGVIEIAIQVANYIFKPIGGIEASLQFGESKVIEQRHSLTSMMHMLVFMVFLLHAAYAVHLYMMGIKNSLLLYIAGFMVIIVLALAGNGNKLIYDWFPLTYIQDFRLKGVLLSLGGMVALCISVGEKSRKALRYISRFLMILGGLLLLRSLAVGNEVTEASYIVFPLYVISTVIVCIIGMISVYAASSNRMNMLLLIISLVSTISWEYIGLFIGIDVVFYPFDLLLTVFFLSSLLFKKYIKTEHRNKQLAEKLQREDKIKDQFLANTSHELRNPLHGILNLSEAVIEREKLRLSDRSLNELKQVLSIGKRMNVLLGDLLDIARLKEQGIQLDKHPIDLHAIVEKIIDSLNYLVQGKEIQLQNEVSSSLPAVMADTNRLSQVLFNLLHNAIKYTNSGSVSVQAELKEETIEIFVVDTGIGIDKSKLDHIFQSYQSVDQVNIHEKGFGLGLSISKQLVELHGSRLEVESEVGRGSVFQFALPIASGTYGEHEAAAIETIYSSISHVPADHESESTLEGEKIHILAVDDDSINLQVLSNVLGMNRNIEFHGTTSAMEVLEKLSQQRWDLIISDVKMPDMSGYVLTSHIREVYSLNELPVLLLTAQSDAVDIDAGLLSGANDYIIKPVNPIELHARVKTLVALKRSLHQRLSLEAAWLQAQIKPHFVINTLNTIVSLSTVDQQRMFELIEDFSKYLRASYDVYNTNQFICLEQELKLVRSYLSIQQKRFDERLKVAWDVDDALQGEEIMLPPLIVQSIIENAVTHGVLSRNEGGCVTIVISKEVNGVRICIKDDGVGMSENVIAAALQGKYAVNNAGIGLYNTQSRLRQWQREGLVIRSIEGEGTEVEFVIPMTFGIKV